METMTQTEINKYKAVLEAKQAELSAGLRNRDDIAIEKTPDAIDEVQLAGERELAIRNLDRESNLLRNVKGALVRIADGSYGVCMHCEEDIRIKRMDAVPWTRDCIKCQEAADRHEVEAESGDSLELLANARQPGLRSNPSRAQDQPYAPRVFCQWDRPSPFVVCRVFSGECQDGILDRVLNGGIQIGRASCRGRV